MLPISLYGLRPVRAGLLCCAILFSALPVRPVAAADAEGNYAVWGVGQASCNQYVNAYEQQAIRDYRSFLAGYLTAFNTISETGYQATGKNSADENLKALYEHCLVNRMSSFELAIQVLLQQTDAARRKLAKEKTSTWGRPGPARSQDPPPSP